MAVEKKGDAGSTGAGNDAGGSPDATKLVEKDSGKTSPPKGTGGSGGGGDKGSGKGNSGSGGNKGESKEMSGNRIAHFIQFIKEVIIEFKKISWPERSQIIRETWSVLFLVAIITCMVLAFDWVLAHAVFMPLENWLKLHGGGIRSSL